jgi:uncharacterized protein YgbK (DUF1537 family)
LGQALAATIRRVLGLVQPARVCVEGGATAALLLQALGWKRLTVEREFATGVVGVHPVDRRRPLLVLKPGSYAWPDCLCAGVGGAGAGQSKLAAYPTARTIR